MRPKLANVFRPAVTTGVEVLMVACLLAAGRTDEAADGKPVGLTEYRPEVAAW